MDRHPHDINTLMGYLGEFGTYQCRQYILHILSAVPFGINIISLVFVTAVPEHRCWITDPDFNRTTYNYETKHLETFIPLLENGEFDPCNAFEYNNKTGAITVSQCNSWVYDTTYYTSSRGMDWNLVCHRKWMDALAKSTFMFGVVLGSLILGKAGDKYGRKNIFCMSAIMQIILGVSSAFIKEYYAFVAVRFLFAIFTTDMPGFILTMELVGVSKRSICSMGFQVAFSVGLVLAVGWGALISDTQILQVVYGLHSVILVGHWWLIDESPRWLWANGRHVEAIKTIQKALKINKSPIQLKPSDYYVFESETKYRNKNLTNMGMANLFIKPNLRKNTINISICWFAVSITYYFLNFGGGGLKGNPFLILFLANACEIVGIIILIFLVNRIGRRSLISFCMIAGGACCMCLKYLFNGSIASIFLLILGKACTSNAFAILYNFTAELFPTVIRNSAVGIGLTCSKLAGVLMPLISLLDYFNPTLPAVLFGGVTVISGFCILFVPETLGRVLPETIEDGENFGAGDSSFFTTCFRGNTHNEVINNSTDDLGQQMEPFNLSK